MKKSKKRKSKKKPSVTQSLQSKVWSKLEGKLPILKFVLSFLLGLILFYSFYFSDFYTDHIGSTITKLQSDFASGFLNLLGFKTLSEGAVLVSEGIQLDIRKGCDGIEPTFFFLIGVLVVPLSKRAKLFGVAFGLIVLTLLNLLRIIILYLVQVYWPDSFDFLHLHGGFTLFFIVTIAIWIMWANWAIRHDNASKNDLQISGS